MSDIIGDPHGAHVRFDTRPMNLIKPIVGINGPAGSGKDSIAQVLVERAGYKRIGFADELKAMLYDLNPTIIIYSDDEGITETEKLANLVDEMGYNEAKLAYPEIRRLLQVFGTEVVRSRVPNFWLDRVDDKIAAAFMDGHPGIVITDVRFPNEANYIRQRGGIVCRIETDYNVIEGENRQHSSETSMSDYRFDMTFVNPRSDRPEVVHAQLGMFANTINQQVTYAVVSQMVAAQR